MKGFIMVASRRFNWHALAVAHEGRAFGLVNRAETKLSIARKNAGRGKTYEAYTIYLPSTLVTDSAFPFKPKERLLVKIQGDRLLVEKRKSRRSLA